MKCKWYESCPMVKFNEKGQLSDSYISRFCQDKFHQCVHFQDSGNEAVFDSIVPKKLSSEDKIDSTVS